MSEKKATTIVILGSGGVGKSCLTVQFLVGKFLEKYDPTIIDAYRKQVEVDGKVETIDLLDTAGQEEFQTTRDLYVREGNSFILVYSITDSNSFYEIEKIHEEIKKIVENDYPPVVLVGNKCDMEDFREVSTQEGKELAKKWKNCIFLESSAKMSNNVHQSFEDAVRLAREPEKLLKDEIETKDEQKSVETKKPKVQKKSGFSISKCNVDKSQIDDELSNIKSL